MAGAVVRLTWHDAINRLAAPGGPIAIDLLRRGNRVLTAARMACPVDTGVLRASLSMSDPIVQGDKMYVLVGSNAPHAVFVHEGTGIYGPKGQLIRPVTARVLRWPSINNSGAGNRRFRGGQTEAYTFAAYVRGMPGRPFLRQALDAAR